MALAEYRSTPRSGPLSPRRWRAPPSPRWRSSQARRRHACRCCGCRSSADDIATLLPATRLLRDGATDVIFLGTGGSSLGGQTLAQLAGYGVPGVGAAARSAARPFHGQSRSGELRARCSNAAARPARFVAVSKSGGTGETLMQTIAALAVVQRPCRCEIRRAFPRHLRACGARQAPTACAPC